MATIQRALISVSDKTNIVSFAQALAKQQIPILSTGGTAKLLQKHGIAVTEVADYTGFPEMMDGRIKTLHPKIHGGLLGRRGKDDAVMAAQGIEPIDLLVVNLYPFAQTIADPHCDLSTAIDNIDIGGPAMLRAAAKNYSTVTVVVDPNDYAALLTEMQAFNGQVSETTRQVLARKVFAHTAHYDGLIANYLGSLEENAEKFPPTLSLQYQKIQTMRYGENPHQDAAFYTDPQPPVGTIASATQIQGKSLSYNNIADADTALECVKTFDSQPTCVIVKHANPCGVAMAEHLLDAYQKAYQTDPTSAFGGIIAFNRTLDIRTAETIINQQFVEVIIAPEVEENAKPLLAKKTNVRVLTTGQWRDHPSTPMKDLKRVNGGLLVQDADIQLVKTEDLKVVSQRPPTDEELQDLLFAWKVVKFVKSNAIVYAKAGMTIGIGAGQMSRVYSAKIAGLKAKDEKLVVAGSVMASDAFFPFRDSVDTAAEAGIKAIIQPGGSKRDEEVIAAANAHHISMVFTGMRHFRH